MEHLARGAPPALSRLAMKRLHQSADMRRHFDLIELQRLHFLRCRSKEDLRQACRFVYRRATRPVQTV